MGGHYGSVQVRSDDREKVLAAAEQVAGAMSIRMLVGPALKGWIGIYPESNGQDERGGEAFTKMLPGHVMHILVHDDDIFAYWLHHDGNLIDSYHSRPGYFGEESRAVEEAMAGNPQAFAPIAPGAITKLKKLLDRSSRPTFEVDTLMQFGKLLGIGNLVAAYEYLQNGERDDIKGWRQFIEVPASAVESAVSARQLIKQQRDRLKKNGVLLAREERKVFRTGACALSGGFLVAWSLAELSQFRAPWGKPKTPTLPKLETHPVLASDANGRRVALATDSIEIWESSDNSWQQTSSIVTSAKPARALISPSGKMASCWVGEQLSVFNIETGTAILELQNPGRIWQEVFHPGGDWLVVINQSFQLWPLHGGTTSRTFYLGGKVTPPPPRADVIAATRNIDVDAHMAMLRKSQDDLMQMLSRSRSTKQQEQLAAYRHASEAYLVQARAELIARRDGPIPVEPPRSKDNIGQLGFTPDGQWLWCNSSGKLLVFAWADFLKFDGDIAPAARWTFEAEKMVSDIHPRYITGATAERNSVVLIVGDTLGRLSQFSLMDGTLWTLFELPGEPNAHTLIFTPDQKYLGVGSGIRAPDGVNTAKYVWEVYDYAKLLEAATAS